MKCIPWRAGKINKPALFKGRGSHFQRKPMSEGDLGERRARPACQPRPVCGSRPPAPVTWLHGQRRSAGGRRHSWERAGRAGVCRTWPQESSGQPARRRSSADTRVSAAPPPQTGDPARSRLAWVQSAGRALSVDTVTHDGFGDTARPTSRWFRLRARPAEAPACKGAVGRTGSFPAQRGLLGFTTASICHSNSLSLSPY